MDESKINNHFKVSMLKSALRVAGFCLLMIGNLWWAGALLISAEVAGVVEEIV